MPTLHIDQYKKQKEIQNLYELPTLQPHLEKINQVFDPRPGYLKLVNQDIKEIQEITTLHQKKSTIVVVGLGGSSLGGKTIVQALGQKSSKKVLFLDNIDPNTLATVTRSLHLEDTVFLIITKSGQTPETIGIFYFLKDLIARSNLTPQDHCVLITDPEKGHLRTLGIQENYQTLSIPAKVGGRFSVLSPVGLLLSNLLDLDITDMLNGAKEIQENTLTKGISGTAFAIAAMQYHEYLAGRNIHVIMPYGDQLQSLSNWCTQLYGESLGKINPDGKAVGFTPLPARGVSDQHSQLQLFKEGPDDKCYIFIKPSYQQNPTIPSITDPSLTYLSDKTFNALMDAEYNATVQSLSESKRPLAQIHLEAINEYSLGYLFMLFQNITSYLGYFLNVNTYNQPGVERSKILTKEHLL